MIKMSKKGYQNGLNISLDGRRIEELYAYSYLGVDVMNHGKMNKEVNHRIGIAKRNREGGKAV